MKHRKNYQNLDLTGKKFGRLFVVRKKDGSKSSWICKCDCGNEAIVTASRLLDRTISCGCALKEKQAEFAKKSYVHGDSYTRLYSVYRGMIDRCYCKSNPNYKRYGEKGIKVCQDWKTSYLNFKDWAYKNGYDETLDRTHQSLDRIDFDGDYSPENCRWATAREQAENKHNTKFYYFNGEKFTASSFADKNNITDKTFVYRNLQKGKTLETILYEWNFKYNTPKGYVDCNTYAKSNNVSRTTVIRKIQKGNLKAKRVGKQWYVKV